MMYRNLVIFLCIYQQLPAMHKRSNAQSIRYQSVVPCRISGIPSLRVLAAQKLHEMNRRGILTPAQQMLFSAMNNPQSSSPEEIICNDILQQDFSQMRKDTAEQYAFDLCSGRIPLSGGGRVKQKILAIEIREKIHR